MDRAEPSYDPGSGERPENFTLSLFGVQIIYFYDVKCVLQVFWDALSDDIKKILTGPQPGSSVPTRVMTRDPEQNIHHSKALHASNPTVGHSSKSVKYEPSYGHLNFHENQRVPPLVFTIFFKGLPFGFWKIIFF